MPPGRRKRLKKRGLLTVAEKIHIVHKVLVDHEKQNEVAREFRVGAVTVNQLVRKVEKKQLLLDEVILKQGEAEDHKNKIVSVVKEMNDNNAFIDSAGTVLKVLEENHQIKAKQKEICSIMKHDLGMSYKKVLPVSIHANSPKNLVCRQQFALKFLEVLLAGKIILNVDETWLGMSDFRRRKWQVSGTTNSVPHLQVIPRISMITGLDSRGQVYMSLLQANSNAKVMEIFFQALTRQLDKERPKWRADTVVLLDNASYHSSKTTLTMLTKLQVPVCFTGPHSYDAAPIELWFAAFKSRDINPRHVPTGKR